MARHYIKDLIKSMLKMDNAEETPTSKSNSQDSLSSDNSDTDDDVSKDKCDSMRSPTKGSRGIHSVKEFEEQLTTLRKENFNLKLRIYFLEERMGTNFNLDKETVVKENVELLVEMESLKKEVKDKQELLCQAVKAMELEEEEHKKDTKDKSIQIAELQQQLDDMRVKLEDFQERKREENEHYYQAFDIPDRNSELVKDLQTKVEELEHELRREKDSNLELSKQVKLLESKQKIASNLEVELKQKDDKLKSLINELESKNKVVSNYSLRIKALQDQLDEKTLESQNMSSEVKRKETDLKLKAAELEELKKLLSETRSAIEADQRKAEKHHNSKSQKQVQELESLAEKQKAKIMYLDAMLEEAQSEVKKKTEELNTLRSPVRRDKSTITDVDSFLVANASPFTEGIAKKTAVTPTSTSSLLSPRSRTKSSLEDNKALVVYQKKNNSIDSDKSLETLEHNLEISKQHIVKLEKDQVRACRIIQSMLETRKEHMKLISDLETELQTKNKEISELQKKRLEENANKAKLKMGDGNLPPGDTENSAMETMENTKQLLVQYKELAAELDKQKQILIATVKEKDTQMQKLQSQYNGLVEDLKIKDSQITDLQFEVLHASVSEKKDVGSEKNVWKQDIEEKEKHIEKLEGELRKRTCDLQSVVNKELWEKNREIEKIQKRFALVEQAKDSEISNLKSELNCLRFNIAELEDEIAALKMAKSNAKHHETSASDDIKSLQLLNSDKDSYVKELQDKCKELAKKVVSSEQLLAKADDTCHTLCERLRELAYFLASLLKQKTIMGFLGHKQKCKLHEFIDHTLDISSTLTTSFREENPEKTLIQLSNISNMLNVSLADFFPQDDENSQILSIVPGNITLTYQSHLERTLTNDSNQQEEAAVAQNDEEFVDALMEISSSKTQVLSPQKILKNLLDDKNLFDDKTTESETYSDPDRNISSARIGLSEDIRPRPRPISKCRRYERNLFSSSSEDEVNVDYIAKSKWKYEMVELKNELAQAKRNEELLKSRLEELEKLQSLKNNVSEDNEELKQMLSHLKQNEVSLNMQLSKMTQLYTDAMNKNEEYQKLVNEIESSKKELLDKMDVKDKDVQNKLNGLEKEKNEALKKLKSMEEFAENMAESTKSELKAAQEKVKLLEMEKDKLVEKERAAFDAQIDVMKSDYESKIQAMKIKTEQQIEKLMETSTLLQQRYDAEYVKRTEVEKLKNTIKELEDVKERFVSTEEKIEKMEGTEKELKKRLHEAEKDYNDKLNSLRKELDNATLQYSEAVLEKTKLINEKSMLEKQIKEFGVKERDFIKQVNDFQKDFNSMKDSFQKRVSHLEQLKANLEIRVSELEVANAELRSKLIKVQCGQTGDQVYSSSAPNQNRLIEDAFNSRLGQLVHYNRQISDNHSGYTSEEIAEESGARRNANSSPDLGIESDHGRFSSLEAHVNVARPYLQTLELAESMNNLLEGDGQSLCNNEECSKKTRQIVNENSELKKRLSRTRHALEETVTQLSLANQRKKQVEKTICKQIHKTSQVLRKAKANLDSGSESDILRK